MSDTPQFPELNPRDAELLSAYLDQMLSDDETRNLEARLERDAQLRNQLRYLRQTVTLLHNLPELTAPRDFTLTEAMLQRRNKSATQPRSLSADATQTNNGTASQTGRGRRTWPLWGGLAAALSVMLVGVLLVVSDRTPNAGSQQIAQAPTEAFMVEQVDESLTATPMQESAAFDEAAPSGAGAGADADSERLESTQAAVEMTSPAMLPPPTLTPAATNLAEAGESDDAVAGEAAEIQTGRSADRMPPAAPQDDAANATGLYDVAPQSAEADSVESDAVPESNSERFAYTPTPVFGAAAPADTRNAAEPLAETLTEAPAAAGGSAESGLAVPDTAFAVQPDFNAQILQVIRLVLDALRLLFSLA